MRSRSIAYLAALTLLLALDAVWLGSVFGPYFYARVGAAALDSPRWLPAAAFYLLYPVGVMAFAVLPAPGNGGSWRHAMARGALLGLVAYATYDLTNLATLKAWTPALALIDIAWGTFATAVSAGVAAWAARRFG